MMPMHRHEVAPPFGAVEFRSALALFFHAAASSHPAFPKAPRMHIPFSGRVLLTGFPYPKCAKLSSGPLRPPAIGRRTRRAGVKNLSELQVLACQDRLRSLFLKVSDPNHPLRLQQLGYPQQMLVTSLQHGANLGGPN